jgi:predicted RNA-binding protein YlxR (DUF448 family)
MQKKTPMRMCLSCGEAFQKRELIRVVKTPEGEIKIDTVGKMNGRGAYICKQLSCLKKARRGGRIDKSLECVIPDQVYDAMEKELEEHV